MILFNKNDKVLSNIASLLLKRFPEDTELEIAVDTTLDEKTGIYESKKITAGSHWKILDMA